MSIMNKEELEIKLIKTIGLFEYLLFNEPFDAYNQLKSNYENLLSIIQKRNIEDINSDDFLVLQSSFRIMFEAPPKDIVLGRYILDRMQEIYEIQIKMFT